MKAHTTRPLFIILTIFISTGFAEDRILPSLTISHASSTIIIDGDLSEPAWLSAAATNHFLEFEPGDNIIPSVETEVRMTYDEVNLYVAFLAYDNPENVRASYQNRDEVWSDDFVAVILDPFGESSTGIMIGSNPFGIQMDLKRSGQNDDPGFDIVYESQGKITDKGFQVEMAIPFSSLSFPKKEMQEWRIGFYRSVPREKKNQILWGGLDRNDPCFLCQLGFLKGIKGIQIKQILELLPAMVGSQSSSLDDQDQLQSGSFEGEPSLGFRYSFSSDLSAEFTLNPDFSQVEADAEQIDVNTTYALYFPEKRPFFNEGAELFKTYVNAVYTRSINNPVVAGRLITTIGKTTFAFLSAIDEDSPFTIPAEEQSYSAIGGKSLSNIFRAKHSLGKTGFYGIMLTDRRMEHGGSGSVAGIDFRYRFNKIYSLEMQGLLSSTEEPNDSLMQSIDLFGDGNTIEFDGEMFNGNAVEIEISRSTKLWHLEGSYEHKTPTFRAENGFITQNNYKEFKLVSRFQFWPNGDIISEYSIGTRGSLIQNFSDEVKQKEISIWTNVTLPLQTQIQIDFDYSLFERFKSTNMTDLWDVDVNINSQFSEKMMMGLGAGISESMVRYLDPPIRGTGQFFYIWSQIKFTKKLVVQPMVSYTEMKSIDRDSTYYSGYQSRIRVNYQFNRAFSFRIFTQYSDFSEVLQIQPLLSYQPSPFTIFYLGSDHGFDVTGN